MFHSGLFDDGDETSGNIRREFIKRLSNYQLLQEDI
jgi:hypothetical protein